MSARPPSAFPLLRRPTGWRETIEGLLSAVLMFVIARHYIVEVFQIPTGSMAPTLVGQHSRVRCPNCRYAFDVEADLLRGVTARSVFCPNCGYRFPHHMRPSLLDRLPVVGLEQGNRVIVDKFANHFVKPTRWSVVVFRHPTERKNYIKRLVGLPGETIRIHHGDVYADGVLLRKPFGVQEQVWQSVFDSDHTPQRTIWPIWECGAGNYSYDGHALLLEANEKGSALLHFARPILDYAPYNGLEGTAEDTLSQLGVSNQLVEVGDLKWDVSVQLDEPGCLTLHIREDGVDFSASVCFGDGPGRTALRRSGETLAESDYIAETGVPHRVVFINYDDLLLLRVDDEPVLRTESPPTPDAHQEFTTSGASIELRGRAALFARIRLYRDLFYRLTPYGTSSEWRVSEHGYFVLGDNTLRSYDSRRWGSFPTRNLLGTATSVLFPLPYLRPLHRK